MIDEYGIEQNPFGQLGKYKEQIGKLLMHNKNVTDLVMPELDNEDFSFEQNWYGCKCQKDIYGEQRNITLRGHCKDTPYFDETITDTRAGIWFDAYFDGIGTSIKNIIVQINVICHKDIIPMTSEERKKWKENKYYGNRVDMICMAIYEALTDADVIYKFGIGKMQLSNKHSQGYPFKPNQNFYGKSMLFLVDDISMSQNIGDV